MFETARSMLSRAQHKGKNKIGTSTMNHNGITVNLFPDALKAAQRQSTDIQGCCEHNINVNNYLARTALQTVLKQADPQAKAVWATSSAPSKTFYKPGGTATIAFGSLATRIKKSGSDPLGRWTHITLEGKKEVVPI